MTNSISILGVSFDYCLMFDAHLKEIAKKASTRVTLLRRIKHFLDARGLHALYNAQVRRFLEYAALPWMSASKTHLDLLDKVQRRAYHLIDSVRQDTQPALHTTLQHRRDVAALTVMHKIQVQRVPHPQGLRLPRRRSLRPTRTVISSEDAVDVPWSNTSQHQRTFLSRAARLWNSFVADARVQTLDTQQAKLMGHRWRLHHNFSLV
nr:uncharacterized protein LOC113829201 [Penaeus vannamei]